ncbi:MAG TPA: ubiquitin, partial [Clostridium sp.]|nr:ubiquitin [Clostridium sp.]
MSEITLEKIDMLRERVNITYSEAKRVLELCNGDVLEALVY